MEGVYLAIGVISIYIVFGPLVLAALYVLFDRFIEKEPKLSFLNSEKKDHSLWTEEDVKKIIKKRKNERISSKM